MSKNFICGLECFRIPNSRTAVLTDRGEAPPAARESDGNDRGIMFELLVDLAVGD
jgi:hypothetical protein